MVVTEATNVGLPSVTLNGQMYPIPPSTVTNGFGTTIDVLCCVGPPMVNSDGTAYLEYEVRNIDANNVITSDTLFLFQINPDNSSASTVLSATTQNETQYPGNIIPDGNGGVLATWSVSVVQGTQPPYPYEAVDFNGGAVGAPYYLPFSPQSVNIAQQPALVLGENGVAFASGTTTATINGTQTQVSQIASFNISSGVPNWTYQAQPTSALTILAILSNGSLAINDSQNGLVQVNASGIPSQISGSLGGVPQYSWTERWAAPSSAGVSSLYLPLDVDSASAWATPKGNASQNGLGASLCPCMSQTGNSSSSDDSSPDPSLPETSSIGPVDRAASDGAIQLTSGTTTYLQLIGDEGLNGPGCPQDPTHCHDVGQRFVLAAANDATTLTGSGSNAVVIPLRVSTVQDVAAALNNNGSITGSVTYYGHGAQQEQSDGSWLSLLAVGQGTGQNTNVSALNVADLSNTQLSNNTSIVLKTCHAGLPPISGSGHSIAQLLANQLNRGVYAWKVGFFFSHSPNATSPNGMPSQTQPMYFFPEGGSGIAPCSFIPNQPEPQHCGGEK